MRTSGEIERAKMMTRDERIDLGLRTAAHRGQPSRDAGDRRVPGCQRQRVVGRWQDYGNGLFEMLHSQGAHPGLSDQDHSTFRLHVVLVTAGMYLRWLTKPRPYSRPDNSTSLSPRVDARAMTEPSSASTQLAAFNERFGAKSANRVLVSDGQRLLSATTVLGELDHPPMIRCC